MLAIHPSIKNSKVVYILIKCKIYIVYNNKNAKIIKTIFVKIDLIIINDNIKLIKLIKNNIFRMVN